MTAPEHDGARMEFWDHLEALRGVLLRSLGLVAVLALAFFAVMPRLFDQVILAPCRHTFVLYRLIDKLAASSPWAVAGAGSGIDVELVNLKLTSQFFIHMSSSLWMALIAAFPMMVWWIWQFVSPALYERERRPMRTAALLGTGMFYAGVAAGYFLVFPLTLRFLADYQLSETIPNHISLESYIDNFVTLCLMMGFVFELPLAAWLLGRMGVLDRSFFGAYRRHAIVALLVLAAVITPTGDPLTLMAVFVPVYALWELSAMLVGKKKRHPEECLL